MQLAIETTGRQGSIAFLDKDAVIDSAILPSEHRTAMSLAPEIKRLMLAVGINRDAVKFVSVAIGPGSFTGLRVGVTTAKTLGFAWGIPLVGVGSLAAIAAETFRCHEAIDEVCIAIDAYRGQAYTADFSSNDFSSSKIRDSNSRALAMDRQKLMVRLAETQTRGPGAVFVSGDPKLFPDPAFVLSRQCDAIGVGLAAFGLSQQGLMSDPMTLAPTYLKPSAAEENAG